MMGRLRETRYPDASKFYYTAFVIIIAAFVGAYIAVKGVNLQLGGAIVGDSDLISQQGFSASGGVERYLITADPSKLAEIKQRMVLLHEFPDGSFSAELSQQSAEQLKKVAKLERVPLLEIPKPVEERPSGLSRRNAERTCLPSTRTPWGVQKVTDSKPGGGAGINLAILDTGTNKHTDLKIKVCKDALGRGVRNGCEDKNGHGTHVAGIATATGGADGLGIYGVAPEANLWSIRVCRPDGTCWADDIADGIYWAANNGANIISLSVGSPSDIPLIRSAIDYATSRGVLIVAAAGNNGPADGSILYPAAYAKVAAAGATDSNDAVAGFSSRGINYQTTPYSVEERDIEFAAPGVSIESTWKDECYRILSGTSMSAPHVAGLAAKLWQGSAAATRGFLQSQARYLYPDIGRASDDPDAGFGLPTARLIP